MGESVNLIYLYPDICSLYGDRGNVLAFEKAAKNIGVPLSVSRVDTYDQAIDFAAADIILVSPCELKVAARVAAQLSKVRDELDAYVESGRRLIAVGNAGTIFGGEVRRRNGENFFGVGLADYSCDELRTCYSNDAVLDSALFGEPVKVVGGVIQMVKIHLGDAAKPLGRNVYGYGNCKAEFEGCVQHGYVHTNLLGPVFVKNPWFAEAFVREAAARKGIEVQPRAAEYELEQQSNREIQRFIDMKIEKYDRTRLDNEEEYKKI